MRGATSTTTISSSLRWLLLMGLLSGMILYKISSFEKNVQEQYLQFLAAGRSAGLTTTTTTALTAAATTPLTQEVNGYGNDGGVCQQLLPSHYSPTALSLWTRHLSEIHKSSQLLPMDPEYEFHDLTAQLLHLISPRLPNSIKAIPRGNEGWTTISHILEDVLLPRWNFLKQQQQQQQPQQKSTTTALPPRPVRIVVMGGSVVAGVNCLQVFAKKVQHKLTREQCSWPFRLQQFLDRIVTEMLGSNSSRQNHRHDHPPQVYRLFEIHTVSMGGSNTIVGNAILEFDLLPEAAKNPDILVNAYSTNDMHLLTFQNSWREETFNVLQDFIRLAYYNVTTPSATNCNQQGQPPPPPPRYPPLVLHLDDYLGNEQRQIMTTTELSQAVHILAQYYGTFVSVSYADVVRDWVLGDTKEFWFSPFEWYPHYKLQKNKMKREIHPGMPMHTVVPWIISYNLLNLLVQYCDRQPYHHDYNNPPEPKFSEIPKSQKIYDDEYNVARNSNHKLQLPELSRQHIRLPGKPHVTPYGLPPPLTPESDLQDVSALWRNHSLAAEQQQEAAAKSPSSLCSSSSSSSSSPPAPKCPFAWVSRLLGEDNAMEEEKVEKYFRQNSLEYYNHGWELRRHVDGKKLGFVPAADESSSAAGVLGANLTMVFGINSEKMKTIRQVVVIYLKSYGANWDSSRLRIRLEKGRRRRRQQRQQQSSNHPNDNTWAGQPQLLVSKELAGFHAKNTSEMYIERLSLPDPIQAGTDDDDDDDDDTQLLRMEATFVSGKSFKIMGLLVCR